jgi:hypothetical protein
MKPNPFRKNRRLSQVLYALSLVFLAFGLFNLGWAVWPPPIDGRQFEIPAGHLPAAPGDEAYASLSRYSLEISWSRWIRRGETGVIHLHLTDLEGLESLPQGDVQVAQVVLVEPVPYPLQVDPPGGVQANLGDDQDLLLSWQVAGDHSGSFPGKMFVSFGFYDETLQELVTVPVAVVDFTIQVTDLWGLESGLVIWLGLVGMLLWGVLFVLGRLMAGPTPLYFGDFVSDKVNRA